MPSPWPQLPSVLGSLLPQARQVPRQFRPPRDMTSPSLQLEDAGYRSAQRQSLYVEDYHGLDYSVRSYRATPHGGSDEIRELQRRFPETLWPPSMRYFPYR